MGCASSKGGEPPVTNTVNDKTPIAKEPQAQDGDVNKLVEIAVSDGDYIKVDRLEQLFSTGDVALIKASYLLEVAASGGRLERRQDLPSTAFADEEMKKDMFADLRKLERAEVRDDIWFSSLVVLSYCWSTPEHPDPDGRQLREVIAPAIEWYMCERASLIRSQIGLSGGEDAWWIWKELTARNVDFYIFWDFTCVCQKPRVGQEDASFKRAIKSMDFLYGHQLTVKWRQTRQLSGVNGLPYTQRGWPFFETMVCWLIPLAYHSFDLGKVDFTQPVPYETSYDGGQSRVQETMMFKGVPLALDELASRGTYIHWTLPGIAKTLKDKRSPPAVPEVFKEDVKTMVFTNGSDVDFVIQQQRRVAKTVLRKTPILQCDELEWGPEDINKLLKAVELCEELTSLDLRENSLGDAGVVNLVAGAEKGLFNTLELVILSQNHLTDDGAQCLADALSQGQFPALASLTVQQNDITEAGFKLLAQACDERGIRY